MDRWFGSLVIASFHVTVDLESGVVAPASAGLCELRVDAGRISLARKRHTPKQHGSTCDTMFVLGSRLIPDEQSGQWTLSLHFGTTARTGLTMKGENTWTR
jgi:hypothetical protein